MERIEIDTAQLGSTGSSIGEMVAQMKQSVQRLYAEVAELNTMWEGPANAAFNRQFNQDSEAMTAICTALEGYVQDLNTARNEYDKCNSDVRSIIDAIRV